jgi:hypothetical protein
MELTAKEILEKHRAKDPYFKIRSMITNEAALAAMKEAVELAFDAGINRTMDDLETGKYPNKQQFIYRFSM